MPYLFYKRLGLPDLKLIRMAMHMANWSVTYPKGIVEDLLVKGGKFIFPIDFVVLDIEEDGYIPIFCVDLFLALLTLWLIFAILG